VGQVEQGVRRVEQAAQVGDQVRREEEPEARLREKAERARVAVEERGFDPLPVLPFLEGSDLVVRLAPLEAALQETRPRKRVARDSGFDLHDHVLACRHAPVLRLHSSAISHSNTPVLSRA
jgi:hypothetical protein